MTPEETTQPNYWMHRLTHDYEISLPLIDKKQLLSIGYSDFSKIENIIEKVENNDPDIKKEFPDVWEKKNNRQSFLNFTDRIKKGDIVLANFEKGISEHVYICKVTGDKCLLPKELKTEIIDFITDKSKDEHLPFNSKDTHLGFFREVEIIAKGIPRVNFIAKDTHFFQGDHVNTTTNINDDAGRIKDVVLDFTSDFTRKKLEEK